MESDHDVIVSINFDSSGVPRTKADYIETSYTKARRQASIISLPPRTILKSCPSLKDVYALHSQSMVQKNIPSNRTVFSLHNTQSLKRTSAQIRTRKLQVRSREKRWHGPGSFEWKDTGNPASVPATLWKQARIWVVSSKATSLGWVRCPRLRNAAEEK